MQRGWMLSIEVELVLEWTGLPGDEGERALNGPTDWILHYIKHTFTFFDYLIGISNYTCDSMCDQISFS